MSPLSRRGISEALGLGSRTCQPAAG